MTKSTKTGMIVSALIGLGSGGICALETAKTIDFGIKINDLQEQRYIFVDQARENPYGAMHYLSQNLNRNAMNSSFEQQLKGMGDSLDSELARFDKYYPFQQQKVIDFYSAKLTSLIETAGERGMASSFLGIVSLLFAYAFVNDAKANYVMCEKNKNA
ncbi:hypothetical protein HN587_02655 [Candidatus Woesearchaeota archaeon]|jgi:hypothetical protein|nr:hypothetical protein [Candidatus Woesearchaeota archaeon]